MPYSFVRLYLFKYDVCVLNYIWINPKRFLIILCVFGSDFYHSLYSCLVLCFSLFKHVLFLKNKCQNFWLLILATCVSCQFWLLVLVTCKPRVQAASSYKGVSRFGSRLASREMPRISFLKSFFVGNLF